MTVESLYERVTEAIHRAETLEDLGAPGMADAYQDLSALEERIAALLRASNPEGALARRGAVRAALKALDFARARDLVRRYSAEPDAMDELRADLAALEAEGLRPLSLRFAQTLRRYGSEELLRLVPSFRWQPTPFPIG